MNWDLNYNSPTVESGITRWFWRQMKALWLGAMNRFGIQDLRNRGFLAQTHQESEEAEADLRITLTALVFALEALECDPDPRIATRATKHLEAVALTRLRRTKMDWIRELPPPVAVEIAEVAIVAGKKKRKT